MKELHLRKKDFEVQWFSGTGGGGQYRNKHQNCCRIIHKETGLRAQETSNRERPANQKSAFNKLAKLIISHYSAEEEGRRSNAETIRNYHGVRNEVHDKASGLKLPYNDVVIKANIGAMIEARRQSLNKESTTCLIKVAM